MKNRGCMIKTLLLTGLLVFADVNLSFASVNLYAAEASAVPETEVSDQDVSETKENMTQVSEIVEQERANLADGVYDMEVTTLVFTQGSTKALDSKEAGEGMDWNLVFLILLAAITGATVAIYGTSKKK